MTVLLLASLVACGGGGGPDAASSSEPSPTPSSAEPSGSADAPAEAPEEPAATTEPEPAADGTRLLVEDSEFGPMLFDGRGQAIYLFDVETTSEARCYDACAEAWPPVLTDGDPVGGTGVERGLLGTTERKDGTRQVTYGGHPLYFYAHEGKREVKCHDVFLNGGNWYVVQPDGDAAPPG